MTSPPGGTVQAQDYPRSQARQIHDLTLDITGRKEIERLLRADVAHKDVLLQEISHRVLNGFLMISGVLELQALRSQDESVKLQLDIAAQRVLAMALVHRRLYASAKDISTVNAKTYLQGLCEELRQGFFSHAKHTLALDTADDLDMTTGKMAVIGLIVSELVINACKYAYKPDETGIVIVGLVRTEDGYTLSVTDSGAGLPPEFDPETSKGLGMSIVRVQTHELGATLAIERLTPGTRFLIKLPL